MREKERLIIYENHWLGFLLQTHPWIRTFCSRVSVDESCCERIYTTFVKRTHWLRQQRSCRTWPMLFWIMLTVWRGRNSTIDMDFRAELMNEADLPEQSFVFLLWESLVL